jgi:hypothetical protein
MNRFGELDSGFLYFAIRQKPDERFVVKIDNLNAIPPRIVKIAAERRLEFEFIFAGDFLAYFRDLRFVAHHNSEMSHPSGVQFSHFEDGEELVFAEFEKGVTLAAVELFEIENVFVKCDRLFDVVHLDGDVIAAVNLYAHFLAYIARPREKLWNIGAGPAVRPSSCSLPLYGWGTDA